MHDNLPYLLGYPASFCMSPDEARRNIWRMIEAEIPGWDGGPALWIERLEFQLAQPNRTRKLNRYGARFTAVEWVWLLRSLLMDSRRALAAQTALQDQPWDTERDAPLGGDALPREAGRSTLQHRMSA